MTAEAASLTACRFRKWVGPVGEGEALALKMRGLYHVPETTECATDFCRTGTVVADAMRRCSKDQPKRQHPRIPRDGSGSYAARSRERDLDSPKGA